MPANLPVEIIGRIIQLIYLSTSKRKAILPLLRVSPTFRIETERLLYSNLCLTSLPQVVKCFNTINSRPNVPRYVRNLQVTLELSSSPPSPGFFGLLGLNNPFEDPQQRRARNAKYTGKVLRSFDQLVDRTLNKLVSLQEYFLDLGLPYGRDELAFSPMWLPPQAPFRLRRFSVNLNLSKPMAAFLESQPGIVELLAPHFSLQQDGRLLLSSSALPKLRGFVLQADVAAKVIPGRPVKKVVLKPNPRHDDTHIETTILDVVAASTKSTIPVKTIDISVPRLSNIPEWLLRPLATSLPNLEHILVRRAFSRTRESVLQNPYDTYENETFTGFVSDFPNLKSLHLPAPSPRYHLREAGIQDGLFNPMGVTIQAQINGQIFTGHPGPPGPPAPAPAPAPAPVVFGPPLPPNFVNPNGNPPPPPPGNPFGPPAGGLQGGFLAVPIGGGGLFGGGVLPPPLPAGQALPVVNGANPAPPPPGAGGMPVFLQNLLGFNQPPAANPPGQAAVNATPPPQNQLDPNADEWLDDAPPLAEDEEPQDGEVVADFFVLTTGPLPAEDEHGEDEHEDHPQPAQANVNAGPPPPAQPAAGGPPPPPQPPMLDFNQVLHQATNMIMQQLQNHIQAINAPNPAAPAGGPNPAPVNVNLAPAGVANGLPPLTAAATALQETDDMPALEPLPPLLPANVNVNAAHAPAPGPAPPLNFQTTFVTAWNPATGEVVVDGPGNPNGDGPMMPPPPLFQPSPSLRDPKVVEILKKGQRELKERELRMLEKWRMGGCSVKLKSVTFDMDGGAKNRTQWTLKDSLAVVPPATPSKSTTVEDGDEDGDVVIRDGEDASGTGAEPDVGVAGRWEVAYVQRK